MDIYMWNGKIGHLILTQVSPDLLNRGCTVFMWFPGSQGVILIISSLCGKPSDKFYTYYRVNKRRDVMRDMLVIRPLHITEPVGLYRMTKIAPVNISLLGYLSELRIYSIVSEYYDTLRHNNSIRLNSNDLVLIASIRRLGTPKLVLLPTQAILYP